MRRCFLPCTIPGCVIETYAKGLCRWHYDRRRKGDVASLLGPRPIAHCVECGTDLTQIRMRWCARCKPVSTGPFINPLVCVCKVPLADPHVDAGMCHRCYRKPLALMAVAS